VFLIDISRGTRLALYIILRGKPMTDKTSNSKGETPTASEKSFDSTPKTISKGTIIMLAATAIFLLIFSILFLRFLNAPAGGADSNSSNTASRANP